MSAGKIRWRDSFDTWPSVRLQVELAPWHWRIHFYRDEIEPTYLLALGPLKAELWANRDPFLLERASQ